MNNAFMQNVEISDKRQGYQERKIGKKEGMIGRNQKGKMGGFNSWIGFLALFSSSSLFLIVYVCSNKVFSSSEILFHLL